MSLLEALRQIEARSPQRRPRAVWMLSEQPKGKLPAESEHPLPCIASELSCEAAGQHSCIFETTADERLLSRSTVCAPEDSLLGALDSLIAVAIGDELPGVLEADVPADLPAGIAPQSPADIATVRGGNADLAELAEQMSLEGPEEFSSGQWLGQETGHNIDQDSGYSVDKEAGRQSHEEISRNADHESDYIAEAETGHGADSVSESPGDAADSPVTLPFVSQGRDLVSDDEAAASETGSDDSQPEFDNETIVATRLSAYATPAEPEEPEKGPYQQLAERIAQQLSPDRPAVLMFTSAEDGAGKTEMLFSLASALLDQVSGEVLVIDANLRNPDFAGWFGLEPARGLNDWLLGVASSEEVVRKTPLPRLSLLPAVKACSREGELPANCDFSSLLEELTASYPLVLIDAPSLAHAETAAFGRHCDGIYLVARLGHTPRRALVDALRVIEHSGGRLLGSVVLE